MGQRASWGTQGGAGGGSVNRLLARSSKLQEMRLQPQSQGQADRRPDQAGSRHRRRRPLAASALLRGPGPLPAVPEGVSAWVCAAPSRRQSGLSSADLMALPHQKAFRGTLLLQGKVLGPRLSAQGRAALLTSPSCLTPTQVLVHTPLAVPGGLLSLPPRLTNSLSLQNSAQASPSPRRLPSLIEIRSQRAPQNDRQPSILAYLTRL